MVLLLSCPLVYGAFGGRSLLPEYFFFHCLHENQVVLLEYYLILKNSRGASIPPQPHGPYVYARVFSTYHELVAQPEKTEEEKLQRFWPDQTDLGKCRSQIFVSGLRQGRVQTPFYHRHRFYTIKWFVKRRVQILHYHAMQMHVDLCWSIIPWSSLRALMWPKDYLNMCHIFYCSFSVNFLQSTWIRPQKSSKPRFLRWHHLSINIQ